MKLILVTFQISISFIIFTNCSVDKENKRKFRLIKYNKIWETVLKKVPAHKRDRLGSILKKLDKQELDLKHQKQENAAFDRELEKSLQAYLHQTLQNYGILDEEAINYSAIKFQDERLQELWNKAVHDSDYSPEELLSLKEEFEHIDNILKDNDGRQQKIKEHDEKDDNEKSDEEIKKIKEMRKDYKNIYHEVRDNLSAMEESVSNRLKFNQPNSKKFTDSRVVELWDIAKNSGKFSSKQLDLVERELKHFQMRIDKLNYWQKFTDDFHRDDKNVGKYDEKEEYKHSQKQIKEHTKFIKKYHKTMIDRVMQRTEL